MLPLGLVLLITATRGLGRWLLGLVLMLVLVVMLWGLVYDGLVTSVITAAVVDGRLVLEVAH